MNGDSLVKLVTSNWYRWNRWHWQGHQFRGRGQPVVTEKNLMNAVVPWTSEGRDFKQTLHKYFLGWRHELFRFWRSYVQRSRSRKTFSWKYLWIDLDVLLVVLELWAKEVKKSNAKVTTASWSKQRNV